MVASYYFWKVRVSFHLQDMYWIDRRLKSNEPNTFVDPSAAHSLQLASVSKLIRDADHFVTNCFRFWAALHAGSKLKLGNTVLLPKNKTKHNTTKRIDEIPTFRTRWHVYKTFPVTALIGHHRLLPSVSGLFLLRRRDTPGADLVAPQWLLFVTPQFRVAHTVYRADMIWRTCLVLVPR